MAKYRLGDIPGARFHGPEVAMGALASNGAVGVTSYFGPFAQDIRIRNVWWTPTAASQAATQSASYRLLALYNGGTAGTATATTARIASLAMSATVASLTPTPYTLVDATGTTQTVASGSILYFSQSTVGGTDSNGTVTVAANIALEYEVL